MDEKLIKLIRSLMSLVLLLAILSVAALPYLVSDPELSALKRQSDPESNQQQSLIIRNGVHTDTGLLDGEGLALVINNCTNCHSAKLITQNRMDRDRWLSTIRWMQKTQNLWNLGKNENAILDYLAKNYAPTKSGRRRNLAEIEWYTLDQN